jgi:hypothetical protein
MSDVFTDVTPARNQSDLTDSEPTLDDRAVQATLEWDAVYTSHRQILDDLRIDQESYVAISGVLIEKPGLPLIRLIENQNLGVWQSRSTLSLNLLPLSINVAKFYKYLVTDKNLRDLVSVVHDLEKRGEIFGLEIKSGVFFYRSTTSDMSRLSPKEWHFAIGEYFESQVSWLSAI